MRARALYDFVADAANGELSFREGDIIDVTNTVRAWTRPHARTTKEAGGRRRETEEDARSLRVRARTRTDAFACGGLRAIRRAAMDGGKENSDPRRESSRKTTSR